MATRMTALPRRSINSVRQTLAGAAFGASVVCAFAFFHLKAKAEQAVVTQEPIVAAYDMVEVPVPVQPVLAGTRVSDITFRRISYPRHQVPAGAVLDPGHLRDSISATVLPANMPLFAENFSKRMPGINPVVERIPPGMRAMTIRVDATSAVEGWAGSGSVVDVLLVTHDKTAVIAEQVKVLSAERVVTPVEGASSPQVPSTATLLVNQEQCLAINTAIPLGKIAFALRSPGWMDECAVYSRSSAR